MNDLERAITTLLQDRAGEVAPVSGASERILRRAKRRQVETVVAGVIGAMAIAAALVFGVKALNSPNANVPASKPGAIWTTGGELPVTWSTDGATARFEAVRTDWQVTAKRSKSNGENIGVMADGKLATETRAMGLGLQYTAPNGTMLIEHTGPGTQRVWITLADGTHLEGRWLPVGTAADSDRFWVIPVPQEGSGILRFRGTENEGGPTTIMWPVQMIAPTGVIARSDSREPAKWLLTWSSPKCPTLTVEAPGSDRGTSRCVRPWDGDNLLVTGVYGRDIATVAIVGPSGMQASLKGDGMPRRPSWQRCVIPTANWDSTNFRLSTNPSYYGTSICIFEMTVGRTWTVVTRAPGFPLPRADRRTTIMPEPGRLRLLG
jgi:hypothetical protein